jgi:hypothetical protein
MGQTILSAVFEVRPESADVLRKLIVEFRLAQEDVSPPARTYDRLKQAVPVLHFMAMTVFADAHYDPIFVIEANFDGEPAPFWAQLEAAIAAERRPASQDFLRDMLRCCKPPRDPSATLFAVITALGSQRPIAPYLETRTVLPAVGHQGNRGLTRTRILEEAAVFDAVQQVLEDRPRFAAMDTAGIHRTLREALVPRHPTLAAAQPPRIPDAEGRADKLRLGAFAALAFGVLSLPALVLLALLPAWWVVGISVVLSILLGIVLSGMVDSPSGKAVAAPDSRPVFSPAVLLILALLACIGVLPALLLVLIWLRWLERRDPPQDAPPVNEAALRAMAEREDRIVQNHMGSLVLIKPGVLRAVLIRAGLRALGLILRVVATDGYLADMRTIHFAHWAIVSNGSRLMFFSNFDGSWDSYLDDFIEKAHGGLTLAWCNGVGFPPTRFAWLDGATNGRRFKAWARHSMAPSLFWFSAYRDLTVNRIERNAVVAEGLRLPALPPEKVEPWIRSL